MNAKIRELAEQAGFVMWEDESWNPGDTIDWGCRYDDEFKKFAQLIVQECAGIADEYDGVGSTIVSRIEKHFGVEE